MIAMIDMSAYRTMMQYNTAGRARKHKSDMIIENTFSRDPEYQIGYFYDASHDLGDEKYKYKDMHPQNDSNKYPIELKLQAHTNQTYAKDEITFHIMFKPSQECPIDYYEELFAKRYDAIWPVGMYVDLMDSKERYNRWLVVAPANYMIFSFPTFEVLPCNKLFQWIHERTKYQCVGVHRSQNSYNSGIWTDNIFTAVEDQDKIIVPMNRETETLFYDKRMIVDNFVLTEPRTWKVSKVERHYNNGVAIITLYQDLFNHSRDYIELDSEGNVIGMWADYYKIGNESAPEEKDEEPMYPVNDYTATISMSGATNQLKVGGSYKTFTMHYYDLDGNEIEHDCNWEFLLDDNAVPDDTISVLYPVDSPTLDDNQIRIKFIGDESYYGSVLTVHNGEDCSISVDIVGF